MIRPCECCHSPFQVRATGGEPQRFCSKPCSARFRERGPDPVGRTCQECGTGLPSSRRVHSRFCSEACANTSSQGPGSRREQHLVRRYGILLERLEEMLAEQGGGCAVCGTDAPGTARNGTQRWHVDHDHGCCPGKETCGKCVRGILCQACNKGLGHFGDDVDRVMAAAAYLLSARDVLASAGA